MTDMNAPNTDPLTFVSIGQDPTKPDGWNVVTLSNGEVWKYASIVERDEGGIIVQRIALTNNETGEIGPDGPVLTPAIVDAINAVGGNIPPIHATKIIPPTPPTSSTADPQPTSSSALPGTTAAATPPGTATTAAPTPASIPDHADSLFARIRNKLTDDWHAAGGEGFKLLGEIEATFAKLKAHL
jgi:hypothetical protein